VCFLALLAVWEWELSQWFNICRRSWQLLRWILLPTLLLHALLTPGALLYPGMIPLLTYEGLLLGVQLSVHWASIFMGAVWLGRVFSMTVCLRGLRYFPRLQQHIQPYLRLVPGLNRRLRALLRRHYRKWNNLPHQFRQLPESLAMLLLEMQRYARRHATHVWLHWYDQYDEPIADTLLQARQKFVLSCVLLGIVGEMVFRFGW